MPPEPKVIDPVPDPPAINDNLGFDAEASNEEAEAPAEDDKR